MTAFFLASRGNIGAFRMPPTCEQATELPANVIARAQSGERDAKRDLLLRYTGVLHSLVRRSRPQDDAEEITQQLLEHVLVALPQFRVGGSAKLTTWVLTVAQRFLIDLHRKRHLTLVPLEEAAAVRDETADPLAHVVRLQLQDSLESAIATLPEDQRRLFVLVHIHGQTLEDAARVEMLPLGTVKSRLFRAKATLAALLRPRLRPGGDDAHHR